MKNQSEAKTVLLTGATGMVGKGVLLECLEHPNVNRVVVVGRSSIGVSHPKIQEILVEDLTKIGEKAKGIPKIDACFFCMGVSVMGLKETQYHALTFEPVKAFVDVIYTQNPEATFVYVSGAGTDSSEKGTMMWARIKGKTENYVLQKGFRDAYAFRPGLILPEKGIAAKTPWYNGIYRMLRPFFPLLKKLKNVTTTTRVGQAMLQVMEKGTPVKHISNSEINQLANA